MKEEKNEIRCKLHITSPHSSNVRNLWMCLNYDQKPTIRSIIDHIKRNYASSNEYSNSFFTSAEYDAESVKIYLDEYWLPPCESSRLIRENDTLKVEMINNEEESFNKEEYTYSNKAMMDQPENYYDYYQNYYNQSKGEKKQETKLVKNTANETKTAKTQIESQKKGPQQQPQQQKAKSSQATKSDGSKQPKSLDDKCYKKFAVGGLINLLKEEAKQSNIKNKPAKNLKVEKTDEEYDDVLSEDQTKNKPSHCHAAEKIPLKQFVNESVNLDKIANNLISSGTSKWKNSAQTTKSNGPKHIRFSSTSESSSSSSSSGSESDDENSSRQQEQVVVKKTNNNNVKKTLNSNKQNYYEPTKEEQLNAVSYNRSFDIQNPRSLADFKKVFNQAKLNAPSAEELMATKNSKIHDTSSSSSSSSTSTKSDNGEINKLSKREKRTKRRSPSPQIDFSKFEQLKGEPRINDIIAFQILEISRNFTPEISKFKTGTVVEFDRSTNEVTLRLDSKYNSVLKRPSKFSVVLDETETDDLVEINEEDIKVKQNDENLLKIDWRNLQNVKLMPKEQLNDCNQQLDSAKPKDESNLVMLPQSVA